MIDNESQSGKSKSIEGGTIVTIGTFDGIHLGHQKVLERVVKEADGENLPSLVISFDPHPLRVLRPSEAPELLSTVDEKLDLLSHYAVDYVEIIPFTHEFSRISAEEFVREILLKRYHMRKLVIGFDHGFGRGREGSLPMLQSQAGEMGFNLVIVEPFEVEGEKVSSSRIRKYISNSDFDYATRVLGRPYSMITRAIKGDGRGTSLGFPTANLNIQDQHKLIPPDGVYAVRVTVKGESRHGMMHQGKRPTFPGAKPSIEVHILDFDGDLLDEELKIEYISWIRAIEHFEGATQLKEQLLKDREIVEKIFLEE
jgi:riboflavin kinase/FMN adenylyltransferase